MVVRGRSNARGGGRPVAAGQRRRGRIQGQDPPRFPLFLARPRALSLGGQQRRRRRRRGGPAARESAAPDRRAVVPYRTVPCRAVPGAVIGGIGGAERGALCQIDVGDEEARQHEEAILQDRQHVEGAQQLPGEGVRRGPPHGHRRGGPGGRYASPTSAFTTLTRRRASPRARTRAPVSASSEWISPPATPFYFTPSPPSPPGSTPPRSSSPAPISTDQRTTISSASGLGGTSLSSLPGSLGALVAKCAFHRRRTPGLEETFPGMNGSSGPSMQDLLQESSKSF